MIQAESSSQGRPSAVLVVAMALMAIGVVMVASSSASLDRSLFSGNILRSAFGRQLVFVAAGLGVMVVTSRIAALIFRSPGACRWLTRLFFVATVALLIAALIPGLSHAQRGSSRWLGFTVGGLPITVQPSELAKLAMVGLLASVLTGSDAEPRSFRRGLLPSALVMGLCVVLVGKEDFGTSVLLACVGAGMLVVAGCRFTHLTVLGLLGAGGLAALLFGAEYRLERLKAYRNIWADPEGAGYQPIQSLLSIASGGWIGSGLGGGLQKYGYLPESHTDFIFAVICEEAGILGGGVVIALYCVFLWLGMRIMRRAVTPFEQLLAFGLTAIVGLQAAMNIAVVTVVAPTTGISLPLVSAGGSGLLTLCLAIGLLGAIALRGGAESTSTAHRT